MKLEFGPVEPVQVNPLIEAMSAQSQDYAKIAAANNQARHNRAAQAQGYTANDFNFGAQSPDNMAPGSLIHNESGGRFNARNNEVGAGGRKGHFGRIQFGHARLQEARDAGAIPANMTADQFLEDPEAQMAAERWHWGDITNRIRANGYDRYIGSNIGGVDITMDAMKAMSHLGGFGGMSRFINSGGQYNPSDSFGTSLKDYGQRHG